MDFEDLIHNCWKVQLRAEDDCGSNCKEFLFCTLTWELSAHLVSANRFGKTQPRYVEEIEDRVYDFILVDGLWVWMGTWFLWREHQKPEMRFYFFQKYLELAKSRWISIEIISDQTWKSDFQKSNSYAADSK